VSHHSPRGHAHTAAERAKIAVAVVFVLNGLAFASWVSRMPSVRDDLGLTAGQVGLMLLFLSGGTLLALPLSGVVVGLLGAARTVGVAAVVAGAGLLTMAGGLAAASVPLVAAGMVGYGVGTSAWDVAMNVEAADVERRLGRAIMPRFHAGFSIGTVAGAGLGALSARLDISLTDQLVATVAVFVVAVPIAVRSFMPVLPHTEDSPAKTAVRDAWREPRTLAIGLLVLAFALCEGIANDWVALALVDGYDADESVGAIGFGVFVAAMTVGRLFGGVVVERLGRVAVLRLTAGLVAVGVLTVVLSPGLPGALVGAVVWGLGASLGFPLGMSAAGEDEGGAAARVSVVSSIGYAAFLGGPPLIGLVADHVGVRNAIALALVAALVGAVAARAAAPRRATARVG
jgi:MFS family permease